MSMERFIRQHHELTRRYFLRFGAAGLAAFSSLPLILTSKARGDAEDTSLAHLESWLTRPAEFQDVSRGDPKPHSLPEAKRAEVGLTRETWKLEVLSDPDHPTRLHEPMSAAQGTALDFAGLMRLAENHAVRFPKLMTCLNLGCPLGNGIWEGVPLREVLWLTEPREDLRRVFYHGYHNDDSAQMFRSSLPVGRVLEDPFDLPPVILCYKLNGQWLTPERGGPVRVVVPEAYGFKSIKWLTHVYLSNLATANDTYAEQSNDVDSPLKTFCATLQIPSEVEANTPIPVTGYAQVGISGLSKVQTWVHNEADEMPEDGRLYTDAPWRDAEILPPPDSMGGDIPDDRVPPNTMGFDNDTGRPLNWPLRLTKAHWATLLPGLPPGEYSFRCRTVDSHGHAQPMPRPFRKSGHAAIERVRFTVVS
ncbi:MAG: molybdopterin-dependent oxidoreductase [Pirellulales bacterium]